MTTPTQSPSLDRDAPSYDKVVIPGLEHVVWTKATTKNGQSYAIGVGRAAKASTDIGTGGPIMRAHGETKAFNIDVKWPVTGEVKVTTTEVYDVAGIEKYELSENGWWNWYKYSLWIKNNVNYTYGFKDESPDTYYLTTIVHGEHYVQYNSDKPTIIHIKGD